MKPSWRIILNITTGYGASVFSAGMMLFSRRWVLNAMGSVDYGLYMLVGSLIVFVTFLNSILTVSVSRHYAYAIGQGLFDDINGWFNAALFLHFCIAVGLVVIGGPIGEYIIVDVLNIPTIRIFSCLWVFRISLVSAFAGMVSVPFTAMLTAQQRITELAMWNAIQVLFVFILSYVVMGVSGDHLVLYAIGMSVIIVLINAMKILRACLIFPECRIVWKQLKNKQRYKDVSYFAAWNLIGMLGGTLRNQGTAVLLNLKFGPNLNAAYGIANQVSVQVNQLANELIKAFSPEIITSEGRGAHQRVIILSLRVCKFSTLLSMLFAIPLLTEMDLVLKLWLGTPPQYTAVLCRLILWTFLIDRLTAGFLLAVQAHGRISGYQMTVGVSMLLTLPLAWVFLTLGYPPASVGSAFVIMMTGCTLGRIYWARKIVGIGFKSWLRHVFLPVSGIAAFSAFAAVIPYGTIPSGVLRLFITTGLSVTAALVAIWVLGFDMTERVFFKRNMLYLFHRTTNLGAKAKYNPNI